MRRTITDRASPGVKSQFGRRQRYANHRQFTETPMSMIRFASLLALACVLCGRAGHAQVSTADLLTRIDRLEAALRELTGTVEQLQYRNQQLEQEVQRLQAAAPSATPPRPTAQYSPPPPPYSPAP